MHARSRGNVKARQRRHSGGTKKSPVRFPVVGIGASAGGIEPLETLFRGLSPDFPMALVVIMHLTPGAASQLPEILARCTSIPDMPSKPAGS